MIPKPIENDVNKSLRTNTDCWSENIQKGSLKCSKNPPKSTLGPTSSPQGCPKSCQYLSETPPRHHFDHFSDRFGSIFYIVYTQFLHTFHETSNNRNQQHEQKQHTSSMIPAPTIVDFGLAGFRLRITISSLCLYMCTCACIS